MAGWLTSSVALFGLFSLLFVLEVIVPARREPFNAEWLLRSGALNLAQVGVVAVVALTINSWLVSHAFFRLPAEWSPSLGGAVAVLFSSFFLYWWHRAEHASAWLWRVFHQIHHSPRRIEVLTANYAHPLDFLATAFVNSVASFVVFGLSVEAAGWCVFYSGATNYFIHSNLGSPSILGYFLQRPEMHRVHHQSGHHTQNFGLPLWDLLFGTWVNPSQRVDVCGFTEDRERQLTAMLLGHDLAPARSLVPSVPLPERVA